LDDAQIASAKATADWHTAEANRVKNQNENLSSDQQVIQKFNDWMSTVPRDQLYDSKDHPEIQEHIQDTLRNLKTDDGRKQFDQGHGSAVALGRQIAERIELDNMHTEGKDAFHTAMSKADPSQPEQVNFESAMNAGRLANGRAEARLTWSTPALEAYRTTKLLPGKTEEDAFAAGLTAEQQFQSSVKKPPAEQKVKSDVWKAAIKKYPWESDKQYSDRSDREGARLEIMSSSQGSEAANAELQRLNQAQPPGKTWIQKYIPPPAKRGIPTGQAAPAGTPPTSQTTLPAGLPGTMLPATTPGGTALAQGTSPLLPGSTAPFVASADTQDLEKAFHDYYGTGPGTGEEETTPNAIA
jgi:hypothetical protein